MLEQWLVWERDLFFALNGSDFEWLDRVMWIYTGKMVWLPLAALILFLLFYPIRLSCLQAAFYPFPADASSRFRGSG